MLASETEAALRRLLRGRALPLKSLTARDVLTLASDFWVSTTIDGTRQECGDGLVAYFDLLDRKGTVFEFGINRIMRDALKDDTPYQAWLPASVLHFSICFRPTAATFQIKSPVTAYACWTKDSVATFIAQVLASPQFKHCESEPQKACSIRLYEGKSPWGSPDHPTQGYSWAVG